MSGEKQRVDAYLDTISRTEPDIAMIDTGAALASIAISLKRIADALDAANKYNEPGSATVRNAIASGLVQFQD